MKTAYQKLVLAVAFMATAGSMAAQELNSAYFTQDYMFRHDLNPAFGNSQNYVSIPVLGNMNVKMQGNFGLGDVLFKDPATGKYNRTFLHPEVTTAEALKGIKDGFNRINSDVRLTILSAGFKAWGGYNTIELNERTSVGVKLPGDLFKMARNVENKTYNFDVYTRAVSFAELAFGHSRQINNDIRVGAKLKFLFGVGRADLQMKGVNANFEGDTWTIESEKAEATLNMKGLVIPEKTKEYKDASRGTYKEVDFDNIDVKSPGISGFGMGLDLGAEWRVIPDLKVSAALVDLGFLSWNTATLLKQSAGKFTFDGFHEVPVKKTDANGNEVPNTMSDQGDKYADQLSDFVALKNMGEGGSKSGGLVATMNLGAEYTLPMYKPMSFGFLFQQHFGSYAWTEARLSANWTPLKWLDGGLTLGLGTFGASTGWLINIHPKGFNFFIGMDHILGKMAKQGIPLSSHASVNLGMNITF